MKTDTQRDVLAVLSDVLDLWPNMRVGQLIALVGDFGQMEFQYHLADLEDEQLLTVLERQRADLLDTGRTLPDRAEESRPLLTESL